MSVYENVLPIDGDNDNDASNYDAWGNQADTAKKQNIKSQLFLIIEFQLIFSPTYFDLMNFTFDIFFLVTFIHF